MVTTIAVQIVKADCITYELTNLIQVMGTDLNQAEEDIPKFKLFKRSVGRNRKMCRCISFT